MLGLIKKAKKKGERFKSEKVWLYRNKSTGEPKGDATVTYEDPQTATAAVKWFNGQKFKGTDNILSVSIAQKTANAVAYDSGAIQGGGGGGYGWQDC